MSTNEPTQDQIERALAVRFNSPIGEASLQEWLIALLENLWDEVDGFTGKRPFGDSDWIWDPAEALMEAGLVEGHLSPMGYVELADVGAYQLLVARAIKHLATK